MNWRWDEARPPEGEEPDVLRMHAFDVLGRRDVSAHACLVEGRGPAARLLRSAPLTFVGRLSYGVYLVHLLAMAVVYRLLPVAQWPPVVTVKPSQ